jgi:hypothetical protein
MVMIGTEDGNPNALAGELIDLYKTIMVNDPRYEIGTWTNVKPSRSSTTHLFQPRLVL